MSTWVAVYRGSVDGDPVRALPAPFHEQAARSRRASQDVDTVATGFRQLDAGAHARLRGRAAEAVAGSIDEVRDRLDPIDRIFRNLEHVLRFHAWELQRLQQQAAHALSRAWAAYRLRQAAQQRHDTATRRCSAAEEEVATSDRVLHSIHTQLATLDASPESQLRRSALEYQQGVWYERRAVSVRERDRAPAAASESAADIRAANERLEYWRIGSHDRSWRRLRDREDALNASTATRIGEIDLTGMADPGMLQAAFENVAGWLSGAADFIRDVVEQAIAAFVSAVSAILDAVVRAGAVLALFSVILVGYVIAGVQKAVAAVTTAVRIAASVLENVLVGTSYVLLWGLSMGMERMMRPLRELVPNPTALTEGVPIPTSGYAAEVAGRQRQDRDLAFAKLARDVYGDREGDVPGLERVPDAELRQKGIDPSALEDPATGFRVAIYHNKAEGGYVVAFEGSATDGMLGSPFGELTEGQKDYVVYGNRQNLGLPAEQYDQAVDLAFLVESTLGDDAVFTGHSLGGGLATVAALATGNPAVTFNAAGVHPNTLYGLRYSPELAASHAESGLIRLYSTAQDPLTNSQESGLLPEALGTHYEVGNGRHGIDDIIDGMESTQ